MHNQTDAAKVLREAAQVYKVDVDTITATVKQEFAAKERAKNEKKATPNSPAKPGLPTAPIPAKSMPGW